MQTSTASISPILARRAAAAPKYNAEVWREGFVAISRLHSAAWETCLAVGGIDDDRNDDPDWKALAAAQADARSIATKRMNNATTGSGYLDALIAEEEINVASTALRGAVNKMLENNIMLCVSVATKSFPHSKLPLDDRMQHAALGCLRAIRGYDHTRGATFSTYATYWIKHAIRRAEQDTAKTIRIPVHVLDHQGAIAKAERAIMVANGGEMPNDVDLAKASNRTRAMVEIVATIPQTVKQRPNCMGGMFDTATLGLADPNAVDFDEALDDDRKRRALHDGVAVLRPLVRVVMERRLGIADDMDAYDAESCAQIASRLGLSCQRVQQLAAEGVKTLHVIVPALMAPADRRTDAQRTDRGVW